MNDVPLLEPSVAMLADGYVRFFRDIHLALEREERLLALGSPEAGRAHTLVGMVLEGGGNARVLILAVLDRLDDAELPILGEGLLQDWLTLYADSEVEWLVKEAHSNEALGVALSSVVLSVGHRGRTRLMPLSGLVYAIDVTD